MSNLKLEDGSVFEYNPKTGGIEIERDCWNDEGSGSYFDIKKHEVDKVIEYLKQFINENR